MRVLICDDDLAMCMLVRIWLEDAGHVVADARTPRAALAALRAERHDVVLLDAVGLTACGLSVAEVRRLAPLARLIVYSGLPPELAAEHVDADVDLYLVKDAGPDHLLDALEHVTGIRPAA